MALTRRPAAETPYTFKVLGGRHAPWSDAYHAFLRLPWWFAVMAIVGLYLTLNLLFAVAYLAVGGVANLAPGSLADAFFFSVQTMGTIGYGQMFPTSRAANAMVVAESVVGLLVTAISTGLVFAKFSQTRGRIVFTLNATISLSDGVPTLMFRLGNERSNRIVEAQFRVGLVKTERTAEGASFYRMHDLVLTRDRAPALTRSWTVMHRITPDSPLFGLTPETLRASEAELMASVFGVDDTTLQQVYGQKIWLTPEIVWGAKHADILTENADGSFTVDLRKFHELVPLPATEQFPYSAAGQPA